jgi:hypothetical protein
LKVRNNLILAYFKICNGFILICDVSTYESIKFLEKQIAKIIKSSKSCYNIQLFVNLREEFNPEEYYHNLDTLKNMADRYSIKPNYVNLSEYKIKNDRLFDRFISNSLIKKTVAKKSKILNNEILPQDAIVSNKTHKNKECSIF